jgi:hypothetical protein
MIRGPRHLPAVRAVAGLLLGLGLGWLLAQFGGGAAARSDETIPGPGEELAAGARAPALDLAGLACGPDPFFDQTGESDLCLPGSDEAQSEEELARMRMLMLESGLLAGRLGRVRTGQEALRERFPKFAHAYTPIVSMGDQITAHGLPMNLAFFETKSPAGDVLEFYAQHFGSRGWSWTGLEENYKIIPHPAISAADPEERVQMTVMVLENRGEGYSTVILGLADMLPENQGPVEDLGDLPVFPGAQPLALRSLDSEVSALTVTFTVPEGLDTVSGFYRERMRELGYAERSAEPAATNEDGEKLQTLHFASQQSRWTLALSSFGGQTGVTAVNSLQEVQP